MAHRSQKFRFSPEREKEREKTEKQHSQHHQREAQDHKQQSSHYPDREKDAGGLSDSSKTISSQEEEKPSKEDREAKKTRVKQSLMKRARSVAIFSLKLKERRAREAETKAKEAEREARWQQPQSCVGGELSCIPIEKLISVDDIAAMELRRLNH